MSVAEGREVQVEEDSVERIGLYTNLNSHLDLQSIELRRGKEKLCWRGSIARESRLSHLYLRARRQDS